MKSTFLILCITSTIFPIIKCEKNVKKSVPYFGSTNLIMDDIYQILLMKYNCHFNFQVFPIKISTLKRYCENSSNGFVPKLDQNEPKYRKYLQRLKYCQILFRYQKRVDPSAISECKNWMQEFRDDLGIQDHEVNMTLRVR